MKWYVEPKELLDYLTGQEREDRDRSIDDICDRLLKQSEENIGHQLDVIHGLIKERNGISYNTLKALNSEQMKINSLILQQQSVGPYTGYGVQKRLDTLERIVTSIEQDKVREEREAWKDKSKLTELWVYLQGKYSEAKNRREAVEDRY